MSRAVLLLIVAACGTSPSAVRLQIEAPPQMVLDEISIQMGAERRPSPMVDEITLLVPDDWSGEFLRLEVTGLRGGSVLASGATEVAPVEGVTVHARVRLVDASCPQTCTLDAVRCDGDGVITCTTSPMGCPVWSPPVACSSDRPFCSNGTCAATCVDECVTGETTCDGKSMQRGCGQADSDTCRDWIASTSCNTDQVCSEDRCTAAAVLTVRALGAGLVTSVPEGITCGTDCTEAYATGTVVTLTAAPDADATFTGWSGGGCSGTGACTVTMSASQEVTATFAGGMATCPATCDVETVDPTARPQGLVQDATYLYWSNETSSSSGVHGVFRADKSGSAGMRYAAPDSVDRARDVAGVSVDASHVYWASGYTNDVMRRPTAGGPSEVVLHVQAVDTGNDSHYLEGVWVDATHVYWLDREWGSGTTIMRRLKAGGPETGFAYGNAMNNVFMNATDVYYSHHHYDNAQYYMYQRVGKTGGTEEVMTSPGNARPDIYVDDTHRYWTLGGVKRVRLAGGLEETVDPVAPYAIVTDATNIYFSPWNVAELRIRGRLGGPTRAIPLVDAAKWIVVDDDWIYWSYASSAGLSRARKCACTP